MYLFQQLSMANGCQLEMKAGESQPRRKENTKERGRREEREKENTGTGTEAQRREAVVYRPSSTTLQTSIISWRKLTHNE